jgi:DNA-binding PucR family transcriptional regulator
VLDAVIPRYQEVSAELNRSRRDHRRMVLAQILDGSIDAITEELDRILGYSLGDTHLAVVIETAGISLPATDIARLRDAADARGTLLAQHTARTSLVWLGRPGGFEPTNLSRLRRALVDTGHAIAVGEPADGVAGLRRTRQHALETQRVQHALGIDGCRCLWAHEVRLEMLLLGDKQRARDFLTDELGPLGAGDSFARRLRETLLAWLTMGSHGSAAAMLGVHENTVRNRLRAAEELPDLALRQDPDARAGAQRPYCSRSGGLLILPVAVFGSSRWISNRLGTLNAASRSAVQRRSSSPSSSAPGFGATAARTSSPRTSSGTPITAHSRMSGCEYSTSSISRG